MPAMTASALAATKRRDNHCPASTDTNAPPLPATRRRNSLMNGPGGGLSAGRQPGPADTAPLYSWFARLYDETTGFAAYPVVRDAVERSITRYQPYPHVAADVGCGTGLLLPYLASVARRVYAVDRSPSMLQLAAARARGLPVTLLRQDLRRLTLPEPANLITCTFDTLNYLLSADDLLLALERFRRDLAAGGVLLFDLVTGAAWQDAPLRIVQRLRAA
jgi:predicted TPR repeat methyltransferase